MEDDVSALQEEMSTLAVVSKTVTACSVIPVLGGCYSQFCPHRHITPNICFSAAGGDSNRVPAYHLLSVGYAGLLTPLFIEIYL